MTVYGFSDALRNGITHKLTGFARQPSAAQDLRPAAVAIVICPHPSQDQASILITLRPQKLNRHGGQYALPGGRLDPGETITEAALRELHEELGLDLPDTAILGQLDDFPTRSGFCISPVVVWSDDTKLTPDPGEVAQVHHLPFSELDSDDIPCLKATETGDHPVLSAYFPTLGHFMYAPTAAILYQFREVAIRGLATRAAHFDQPQFAWR